MRRNKCLEKIREIRKFSHVCDKNDIIFLLRSFNVMKEIATDLNKGIYLQISLNQEFERRMGIR